MKRNEIFNSTIEKIKNKIGKSDLPEAKLVASFLKEANECMLAMEDKRVDSKEFTEKTNKFFNSLNQFLKLLDDKKFFKADPETGKYVIDKFLTIIDEMVKSHEIRITEDEYAEGIQERKGPSVVRERLNVRPSPDKIPKVIYPEVEGEEKEEGERIERGVSELPKTDGELSRKLSPTDYAPQLLTRHKAKPPKPS